MYLLVDLGNTRIKWAMWEPSARPQEAAEFQFSRRGSAENTKMLSSLALPDGIDQVLMSSVASAELLERHLIDVKSFCNCEINIIEVSAEFDGFINRYNDIDALGVDRWVALIGARAIYPKQDLIVIDAGTAVTIDVVSAANEFLGGVIMPGMHLMHRALVGNTAQIRVEANQNPPVIGRNTQECVSSGVRLSVSGGVDRVVTEFKQQLNNASVRTLVCGGDAKWLMNSSMLSLEYNEDLLFVGLAMFYNNTLDKR